MKQLVNLEFKNEFVELFTEHMIESEHYQNDRALGIPLFSALVSKEEGDLASKVGRAILNSTAFNDKQKQSVKIQFLNVELFQGWEMIKKGDLVGARSVANKLAEESTKSGAIAFFQARLVWLETKSPQAGIESAKRYLEIIKRDSIGRSRLFNLIGCAFDELKQYEESLDYFKKATAENETEGIYYANQAEIYEKMGNTLEAFRYAKEALRKKAKSPLCERIVRENRKVG